MQRGGTWGRRLLGRVGGAAIAIALVALAVAATLALTGRARAAGSDTVQIKLPGQASFAGGSTRPLLDIRDLSPGGSVGGTMLVRDHSGETLRTDSIYLSMIDVRPSDGCPAGGPACTGSGAALSDALRFELDVSDPASGATLRRSTETAASLQRGALLGSGLSDGEVVEVRLTASLPRSAGDAVQFGELGFNLRLDLVSVAGESRSIENDDNGGDGHPGGPGSGDGGLVIGSGQGGLASTGAPFAQLAVGAGVLLGLGVVLLIVTRTTRRKAPPG